MPDDETAILSRMMPPEAQGPPGGRDQPRGTIGAFADKDGGGLSPVLAGGIVAGLLGVSALVGRRNAPSSATLACVAGIAVSTSPASPRPTRPSAPSGRCSRPAWPSADTG